MNNKHILNLGENITNILAYSYLNYVKDNNDEVVDYVKATQDKVDEVVTVYNEFLDDHRNRKSLGRKASSLKKIRKLVKNN